MADAALKLVAKTDVDPQDVQGTRTLLSQTAPGEKPDFLDFRNMPLPGFDAMLTREEIEELLGYDK